MSELTCPACYAPTPDGGLCATDAANLKGAVEDARWQRDQLIITTSRQDKITADSVGGRNAETPLPVNLKAGELLDELEAGLTTLAATLGSRQLMDLLAEGRQRLHVRRVTHGELARDPDVDGAQLDQAAQDVHRAELFLESVSRQIALVGEGPDGAARWIIGHRLNDARLHPDAGRWIAAFASLKTRTLRTIDTPRELIPLGECKGEHTVGQPAPCACVCHTGSGPWRPQCDIVGGCGSVGCNDGIRTTAITIACDRRLYAEPGQSVVTCPNCRTTHEVRVRRDAVLKESDHVHGRPRFLAAVMTAAGLRTTESMIRGWKRLGYIQQTFTDEGNGETWYRLGDVRTAWDKTRITGSDEESSQKHEAA